MGRKKILEILIKFDSLAKKKKKKVTYVLALNFRLFFTDEVDIKDCRNFSFTKENSKTWNNLRTLLAGAQIKKQIWILPVPG